MANIAIFASGSGTNYEALTEKFQGSTTHFVKLLICDKEGAFVIERAKKFGTPVEMINYKTNTKPEVEARILELLARYEIDSFTTEGELPLTYPTGILSPRGEENITFNRL